MSTRLVLASQSPRRQELLKLLTQDFSVCVSDVDESLPAQIAPQDAVMLLAEQKARAVRDRLCADGAADDLLVIGADTVVAAEGEILGKPQDAADAARMLRLMAGRTHEVYTGVSLCGVRREERFYCATRVRFAPMTDEEIEWYIATGEPFDKAGGYGIQGDAARFIEGIEGDYFNVMGLPVRMLYTCLSAWLKQDGR